MKHDTLALYLQHVEQKCLGGDVSDVVISTKVALKISTWYLFFLSFFIYNDVGDVVSQTLLLV